MGFALGLAIKALVVFYLGTVFVAFLHGLFGGAKRAPKPAPSYTWRMKLMTGIKLVATIIVIGVLGITAYRQYEHARQERAENERIQRVLKDTGLDKKIQEALKQQH
jgi:hypothetical protein